MARDMTCVREKLFRERGRRCEICGYEGYLEIHHKLPVHEYGLNNNDSNLQILCEKCHADAHGYIKKKYLDEKRKCWIGDE